MSFEVKPGYTMGDMIPLVQKLRDPETGCPWDAEQNHQTIRNDLLEEAYEVADAIDRTDDTDLLEELGDLLFQVVFHAELAREEGRFDLDDVANGVIEKMVLRHPHVFGEVEAKTSEKVLENWDAIKRVEKKQSGLYDELCAVPRAFPALMRGQKLMKRATRAGELPADPQQAADAMEQAFRAYSANPADSTALGNLLLAITRMSHLAGTSAEEALELSCNQFTENYRPKEDK
ncbi:MAG: nucleoside triphosphate pyrophosphohydrolase [Clostridia bacterium]|nr:nucleoside triphosphate pyrophosphohydrolase [Clostridia bacterium]